MPPKKEKKKGKKAKADAGDKKKKSSKAEKPKKGAKAAADKPAKASTKASTKDSPSPSSTPAPQPASSLPSSTQICENCKSQPAVVYCVQCDLALCGQCNGSAHFLSTTQSHERVHPSLTLSYRSQGNCPIHPGNKIEWYCQSCEQPCCSACRGLLSALANTAVTQSLAGAFIQSNPMMQQASLISPHAGENHICISLTEAYQQRHSQLSELVFSHVSPLRDRLTRQKMTMEQKLVELHNNRQKLDDEARAYYEGIKQRLKQAEGPKQAILQHGIREVKDDLSQIDQVYQQISTGPLYQSPTTNLSITQASSILGRDTLNLSGFQALSPANDGIITTPLLPPQSPQINVVSQIIFLKNYSSLKATVESMIRKKVEFDTGSAFEKADQVDIDDFPTELADLQDTISQTEEMQKKMNLSQLLDRAEIHQKSSGRITPGLSSQSKTDPFGRSRSGSAGRGRGSSIGQKVSEEELSSELKQWKDLAEHQNLLLAQLRMSCKYCGIVLSPQSVNDSCPGVYDRESFINQDQKTRSRASSANPRTRSVSASSRLPRTSSPPRVLSPYSRVRSQSHHRRSPASQASRGSGRSYDASSQNSSYLSSESRMTDQSGTYDDSSYESYNSDDSSYLGPRRHHCFVPLSLSE
ncbi:hypothetical protein BLNAU_557 [Blattamonas nauphoetae]|uniref:B box-type domain-containing protein n=1 Tax=Blattamonas nauphoetae TaxID=2049346 RepID=A0ABQ9YLW8_9EUKA|nr:hypothetical protein BLNAU_557 [Blattamonas nauphoetae]